MNKRGECVLQGRTRILFLLFVGDQVSQRLIVVCIRNKRFYTVNIRIGLPLNFLGKSLCAAAS